MLRRFTRGGPKHPTYAALEELGRVRAHDLRLRLPRLTRSAPEIHAGLQVVENWNSGNGVIFYGKDGDLTGPDREHAEVPGPRRPGRGRVGALRSFGLRLDRSPRMVVSPPGGPSRPP